MSSLIKVDVKLPRGALTPQMLQLLDCVFQRGSIRQAAKSKKMAYRTAWEMVQKVENIVGKPVIERLTGGTSGGG